MKQTISNRKRLERRWVKPNCICRPTEQINRKSLPLNEKFMIVLLFSFIVTNWQNISKQRWVFYFYIWYRERKSTRFSCFVSQKTVKC